MRHSIARCEQFSAKAHYSLDELDQLEALSSRFARTADLLSQKLLKTLLLLLREEAVSFLDRARLAEKLGIIPSAEELVAIRDLRNTIAHEYAVENLTEVFRDTLDLSRTLLRLVDSALAFAQRQLVYNIA